MPEGLDFEQPLLEMEAHIASLRALDDPVAHGEEITKLEERLQRQRQKTYAALTAWQRTQLARHPKRPHTRDFIKLLFDDFVELHGDRLHGDDAAVVSGLALFEGRGVVVVGHQKGRDTREKIARNFGMPHPEGYRKALRMMQLAEKFAKPIVTFIDTPGAYPGTGAEERGQAEAIAHNLRVMAGLTSPIVTIVTGEGGSGGALAIGMGEPRLHARVRRLLRDLAGRLRRHSLERRLARARSGGEHADHGARPAPARRDRRHRARAASGARIATGRARRRTSAACCGSRWPICRRCRRRALVEERQDKFRRMGVFEEESVPSR